MEEDLSWVFYVLAVVFTVVLLDSIVSRKN